MGKSVAKRFGIKSNGKEVYPTIDGSLRKAVGQLGVTLANHAEIVKLL